jgi:hypothetical protein
VVRADYIVIDEPTIHVLLILGDVNVTKTNTNIGVIKEHNEVFYCCPSPKPRMILRTCTSLNKASMIGVILMYFIFARAL